MAEIMEHSGMLTARDEDKGGAGVDNASSLRQDGLGAVGDRLVNTPVLARRGGRGEGTVMSPSAMESLRENKGLRVHVVNGASVLGRVRATKGELAVVVRLRGGRSEGNSDQVLGDLPLRVQVVGYCLDKYMMGDDQQDMYCGYGLNYRWGPRSRDQPCPLSGRRVRS